MKIYTKATYIWDGNKYARVEEESVSFDYAGEVALCKGDDTAKQTEQLEQQNAQQQMGFDNQLMNLFQTQYGQQQGVLNFLNTKMQAQIDNPTGYSDQALTAMRTQSDDNLSNQYQNAQKAMQAQTFAGGGRDLPSGVDTQLNGALLAQEASDKAGAQNNITMQNANLQQQNYWNAVNAENGVAAGYNPQSYASEATGASGAATGAGNSVTGLSNAYQSSVNNSFLGKLSSGLASSIGSGLGGALTGGLGTGVSMLGNGNFGW